MSTALSILILIYSQFESAKNYSIRSEKFHQCSLEVGELYNELRMVKTFENVPGPQSRIEDISCRYDTILKKYENHHPIDFQFFKTTKRVYFELSRISVMWIKGKKYLHTKFKYHLMIYGPIVIFIYYQLKQKQ
ncbi:SLATT domain-containing protein [Fulvivirga sp. 29W222]|uniref:SLATT domain-containing protein n=1 Tax=Fulvivirga marina TaxID=2494733 RepID=A0A937G2T7_9BACT|nr:SLATT domain-containing protein [Fulvivirga marina]